MVPKFYQAIVDHLPVGILVLQWEEYSLKNHKLEEHAEPGAFRFVYMNGTCEALLGIPHPRFMDSNLADLLPASLITPLIAVCREVLQEQDMRDLGDIYYTSSDSQGYLRLQVSPLSDNVVLLVLHNVNEQKRIEEERKQTAIALEIYNRKLEASNRELEEFAYVASHDLQEPLRKIMAFGDRLQSKYSTVLDEVGQDYLMRMKNAAARMQSLISDLLNLSRVSTRGQPFEPVDLYAIVADVLKDLETTIEQQGGTVTVGPLPMVAADPVQMRQLFQNLVGNALKFHKTGTAPAVQITSQLQPAQGAANSIYTITVADNGIGFEDKYGDRIFQPFQRLHGTHAYEGTGMGLALCRRIVERHGGAIRAKSQPGLGATFTILLPKMPITATETVGEQ